MEKFSGIVLAGGKSSRMGKPKQEIRINGKTFLELAVENLKPFVSEIIISGTVAVDREMPFQIVPDKIANAGPLGGIFSTLSSINNRAGIFIPVDMPFLTPQVFKILIENFSSRVHATVFSFEGKIQPLCSIYSVECLPVIEKMIMAGNYRIRDLLKQIPVKIIEAELLLENSRKIFANINTPGDLKNIK